MQAAIFEFLPTLTPELWAARWTELCAAVAPLDLSELVNETIDLVRAAIPRTVRLQLDLDPALPSPLLSLPARSFSRSS